MIVRAHRVNYARRQQYRRLSRAGEAGIGAAGTALLGLWAASVSAASRRRVPAHRRRCAWPVRAPLALARSSESGRGPL